MTKPEMSIHYLHIFLQCIQNDNLNLKLLAISQLQLAKSKFNHSADESFNPIPVNAKHILLPSSNYKNGVLCLFNTAGMKINVFSTLVMIQYTSQGVTRATKTQIKIITIYSMMLATTFKKHPSSSLQITKHPKLHEIHGFRFTCHAMLYLGP